MSGRPLGIPFAKMSGLGNDFIVIDDREGVLAGKDISAFARKVCARRLSLGADELMVIGSPTAGGDFSMRTINPDGAEVKMCGNASRCVARFAFESGIAGSRMTIDTLGGPVRAWVDGSYVRVELRLGAETRRGIDLMAAGRSLSADWLEISGAPHAVIRLEGAESAADALIQELGSAVRHHPAFPGGTNVMFSDPRGRHDIAQRSFERGIEGETLACGTGATASALALAWRGLVDSPVRVSSRGGDLEVSFAREGEGFGDILLGGGARFVAEGEIDVEGWSW
jgi:diaminopimelate epimerase